MSFLLMLELKKKKSHDASNIYKYFILECVCSTLSYNYDANLLSFS